MKSEALDTSVSASASASVSVSPRQKPRRHEDSADSAELSPQRSVADYATDGPSRALKPASALGSSGSSSSTTATTATTATTTRDDIVAVSHTKINAKDPSRPRRKKARRACFACQRAHLTCGATWCSLCLHRRLSANGRALSQVTNDPVSAASSAASKTLATTAFAKRPSIFTMRPTAP